VLAFRAFGGRPAKTAETIEAQEERKKAEKAARAASQNSCPVSKKCDRKAHAERHLKPHWFQPGVSGNPGGRPAHDVASEIAQALFTNNPELIYQAFLKVLKKGSPYAFAEVLADRAFGRLKETHAIERNEFKNVSDEELGAKIKELEHRLATELGYVKVEPKILPPADDPKPN